MSPASLWDLIRCLPKKSYRPWSVLEQVQSWNRKGVVFWDSDELAGPGQESLLAGFSSFNQARPHAASKNMDNLFFLNGKYVAFLCSLIFCSSILCDNLGGQFEQVNKYEMRLEVNFGQYFIPYIFYFLFKIWST